MAQSTPTFRTETLVLTEDATPAAYVAEFLNNLDESEEAAVLAYLRTPEFNAYAVCRDIEREEFADDDWGAGR
jgi:hypothetical protein